MRRSHYKFEAQRHCGWSRAHEPANQCQRRGRHATQAHDHGAGGIAKFPHACAGPKRVLEARPLERKAGALDAAPMEPIHRRSFTCAGSWSRLANLCLASDLRSKAVTPIASSCSGRSPRAGAKFSRCGEHRTHHPAPLARGLRTSARGLAMAAMFPPPRSHNLRTPLAL